MAEANAQPNYPTREKVDFVIVGSGAAGGGHYNDGRAAHAQQY